MKVIDMTAGESSEYLMIKSLTVTLKTANLKMGL